MPSVDMDISSQHFYPPSSSMGNILIRAFFYLQNLKGPIGKKHQLGKKGIFKYLNRIHCYLGLLTLCKSLPTSVKNHFKQTLSQGFLWFTKEFLHTQLRHVVKFFQDFNFSSHLLALARFLSIFLLFTVILGAFVNYAKKDWAIKTKQKCTIKTNY